jgi:tripartite-type tricarboxylate transporter receptor subunit TctC
MKRTMFRRWALGIACAIVVLPAGGVSPPAYPTRPIRLIVPFARGGRTGSRRMGWCWGGDGARPPGFVRWMRAVVASVAGAVALVVAMPVIAQNYPTRPIRLIVPFARGGRTGSRRMGWCWGGDGARPPGFVRWMRAVVTSVAGAAALVVAMPVIAQNYPTRPIRLIVPFARGRRTGSRRMGWCWGGDGARPPGFVRWMRAVVTSVAGAAALVVAMPVTAQNYPTRPIRLIVPFAPGGGTDIAARAVAQRLTQAFNQQVIVDNRPGAGTVIGTDIAAHSAPDGYTLLQCSTSLSINPSLRKKLPYDALRDFTPITLVVSEPYVVVSNPMFAAKSIKELIALAKAKPGQITFGSPGTGTGGHLAGELFKLLSGADITHIPYKGNGPALTDLLGGQINLLFATILSALPHVKSGKLNVLAVSAVQRSALLPDVPTVAEAGVPGYASGSWTGVLAPAGTPKDIVAKLNTELVKGLRSPEMRDWFTKGGAEPVANTSAEFASFIRDETAKWAKVIKAANIQSD